MTRIDEIFSRIRTRRRQAFIPYITAGDPDLQTTYDIVLELEQSGADLIELGVPFSDPIADGPIIQRATERALSNGTSLPQILELVEKIRRSSDIPLVLMSYYNPLLNYGLNQLAEDASKLGLDGILASDLTVEESDQFVEIIGGAGLNTIFLVAPTSPPDRVEKIARISTGFLYAVSRTGVTGGSSQLSIGLVEFIRLLKKYSDRPVVVGFGISTPDHVRAVWREADGAVVGSAIVREIEKNLGGDSIPKAVGELVRRLRGE